MARKYEPGAMGAWYRSKMAKVQDGIDEAMEDAGQMGEDLMKEYIQTRGTGRIWAYPRNGRDGSYPGRVDSGKMLRAVGHRTLNRGGSKQLRIGWVSGTREDYFWLQDEGFEHPNGMTIEGMNSLQDATEAALNDLMVNLRREVRNA